MYHGRYIWVLWCFGFFSAALESLPTIFLVVLNMGLTLLKQVAWTIRDHFISFSAFGFPCLCAECRSVGYPMLLCSVQLMEIRAWFCCTSAVSFEMSCVSCHGFQMPIQKSTGLPWVLCHLYHQSHLLDILQTQVSLCR